MANLASATKDAPILAEEGYSQLVLWQGTSLNHDQVDDFKSFMHENFQLAKPIKFVGLVTTLPGKGGPGGRHDLAFFVHEDDIDTFAFKRLGFGMRWIEDVYGNGDKKIYPKWFTSRYPSKW